MQENTRRKVNKVDIDDLVGNLGAKQGERITETLNKSLLNTEQLIKVSLNKIYVSKQIRLKIHQDKVDEIASTYPLRNYPEIRKVDPAIDGDIVPEGYEYVLLTGEHRYHALVKLDFKEHDFKFVPPSLIKSKADVIKYQFVENNIRADMHIIEKAKTLVEYMKAANCNQGEAGRALGIGTSLSSRLTRISKFFTDEDNKLVLDLNINSERVIVGITKLIELGHKDWLSIIKPYALNDNGDFDPELIYESTLTRIIKDLTAPTEPETKEEVSTARPQAESIIPNAFKEDEPVDKKNSFSVEKTVESSSHADNTESSNDFDGINNVSPTKVEPSNVLPTESKHINPDDGHDVAEPVQPPTPSPSIVSPSTEVGEKQASFKLAAKVLQQVLDGKEVEEILINLGPDLKRYVSKDDGDDIYEMIQALPFPNE